MATVSAPVKRARRLRPAPLWLSLLLVFLAYFLLDFSLRLFYGSMSDVSLWAWQPLVFTLLWSGVMTAIAALLPRVWRRVFLLVTFVPFLLLTITHCVLYQLTGTCFSFADLAYAGDGARFISLSYFHLRKAEWLSIALCLALMLCAVIFTPPTRPDRRGGITAAALAVACAVGIAAVHGGLLRAEAKQNTSETFSWDTATSKVEYVATYTEFTSANRCLMTTGVYQYTVRGAVMTIWPQRTAESVRIEELDAYYAAHPKQAADTPMTGARNAEYAENAMPYSLANLFRNAGYRAESYHSASPSIYNRGEIHLNFGFTAYNNFADLGMDDYMCDSQLLNGYDKIVSDEPFFSFIITYSGHGPYTSELQNIAEPHLARARAVIDYSAVPYATEAQKEEYTHAVAHAMETDAFIGDLRERLEADGHAGDTVLMIFTDHYCKYFSDAEFISAIKGETDRNMLSNVPFMIWTEGITPQVSEKYVSTMDIAPTIVDLFSLDADLRYYIGNDIFGPDGGVVYFRDYAWYDGKTYDTGSTDATDPSVLAMRRQVREQVDVSQDTFRYDYFAHLQQRGLSGQ